MIPLAPLMLQECNAFESLPWNLLNCSGQFKLQVWKLEIWIWWFNDYRWDFLLIVASTCYVECVWMDGLQGTWGKYDFRKFGFLSRKWVLANGEFVLLECVWQKMMQMAKLWLENASEVLVLVLASRILLLLISATSKTNANVSYFLHGCCCLVVSWQPLLRCSARMWFRARAKVLSLLQYGDRKIRWSLLGHLGSLWQKKISAKLGWFMAGFELQNKGVCQCCAVLWQVCEEMAKDFLVGSSVQVLFVVC